MHDERNLKRVENECFGLLRKILMTPKYGKWGIFGPKLSVLNLFSISEIMPDGRN